MDFVNNETFFALDFWLEINKYKSLLDDEDRLIAAKNIWKKYLSIDSKKKIFPAISPELNKVLFFHFFPPFECS